MLLRVRRGARLSSVGTCCTVREKGTEMAREGFHSWMCFIVSGTTRLENRGGRIIAAGGTGKHKPTQKWRPLQAFSVAVVTLPKIIQNDLAAAATLYRWRNDSEENIFATMRRERRKNIFSRINCGKWTYKIKLLWVLCRRE